MSFKTQATIAHDTSVLHRVSACAATIGVTSSEGPVAWAHNNAWTLAASPGWAEAFAGSLSPDPGSDEEAISDEMILAAVRSILETGGDV